MSTTTNNNPLKLLAIDYDTNLLNAIHCVCNRLSCFEITTCCTVSEAWEHLKRHNYDIILIETHMPNQEDTDAFVQYVTSLLRIPVIMMSLDDQPSSVIKSISNGACSYWSKPLEENLFKTMWQHVVRKGFSESHGHDVQKGLSKSHELHDELEVKSLKKRGREEDPDASTQPLAKKSRHDELEVKALLKQGAKKSRFCWTLELHQSFLSAVNSLGINNAVPKKILKIMDYPGLKLAHVASHLQKYRNYLKGGIKNSKFSGFDIHGQKNNEVSCSMMAEVAPASMAQDQCLDQSHMEQSWTAIDESGSMMAEVAPASTAPDQCLDKSHMEQSWTAIDESDIVSEMQYSMMAEVAPASMVQDQCQDKSHMELNWTAIEESDIFIDLADLLPDLADY